MSSPSMVCADVRPPTHISIILTVAAAENNIRVGLARSMASAGARAYNGGLGRSPQRGSRGQVPRWGSGGKAPEADGILVLEHFCALPEAFYTLVSYSLYPLCPENNQRKEYVCLEPPLHTDSWKHVW